MNNVSPRQRIEHSAMRGLLSATVVSIGALMLIGCNGANDPGTALSKSSGIKTALKQTGKGKSPAPSPTTLPSPAGSATVTWSPPTLNTDGSTLSNLVGYRIYYGTSASKLSQTIDVAGATVTSHVVGGLSPGTYYFAVAAIDATGVASNLTTTVSAVVP